MYAARQHINDSYCAKNVHILYAVQSDCDECNGLCYNLLNDNIQKPFLNINILQSPQNF